MSEFNGKQIRNRAQIDLVYEVNDVESMFGPAVELTRNDEVALVQKLEAFRSEDLYEIVEL